MKQPQNFYKLQNEHISINTGDTFRIEVDTQSGASVWCFPSDGAGYTNCLYFDINWQTGRVELLKAILSDGRNFKDVAALQIHRKNYQTMDSFKEFLKLHCEKFLSHLKY